MEPKQPYKAGGTPQTPKQKPRNYGYAAKKDKKSSRRWRFWLLWVMILIPVIYFTVQIFIIMMPRMKTQVAIQDTMTESVLADGFVVLESIPVTAESGVLYYSVPMGQRVSAGSEVARIFPDERGVSVMMALEQIDEELEQLLEARNTYGESGEADIFLKQMQDGLLGYIGVLESGDFDSINEASGEVALAANRLQVVTGEETEGFADREAYLLEQRQRYEQQAEPTAYVHAPETGFFVLSEKYDTLIRDYQSLADASPKGVKEELEAPPEYYGEDVVGHIVKNYKWSFFTVVSLKEAEKFKEGSKLELTFPDVSDETMPVKVEEVVLDEENEIAKIELSCEYMSPSIMRLRTERAEIIFRTEKGIRVDKNALRIIEGEHCVYVKFGNQVFKRPVDILLEDENYLLLPEEYKPGVNEVELYDEIIVDSGGEELYDKKIL